VLRTPSFWSDQLHPEDREPFTAMLERAVVERASQLGREYLSRMSHELRTPLNAILGFAQLLDLDDLDTEQRDNLGRIMSGARHLLSLINEVLDIAAIEAGRLSLSQEPVALADVAAEKVSLIRPLADQHHILLAGPNVSCTTHVLGDRQRLKQVLLNLLSKRRQVQPRGGSVHLECEPVPGDRLRIKVTDTGLGLPLSKRLAEAMGGTLELVSTPTGAAPSGSSSPWPGSPSSTPSASSTSRRGRRSSRLPAPSPSSPSSTSRTTCPTSSWSSWSSATGRGSG
jgi:signal transduction histidine kinase